MKILIRDKLTGDEYVIDQDDLASSNEFEVLVKSRVSSSSSDKHKLDIKVDVENGVVEIGNICIENLSETIEADKLNLIREKKSLEPDFGEEKKPPVKREIDDYSLPLYLQDGVYSYAFYDFSTGCEECIDYEAMFHYISGENIGITLEYNNLDAADAAVVLTQNMEKIKHLIDKYFVKLVDKKAYFGNVSFAIVCKSSGIDSSFMIMTSGGVVDMYAVTDVERSFFSAFAAYIAEKFGYDLYVRMIDDRYFTNVYNWVLSSQLSMLRENRQSLYGLSDGFLEKTKFLFLCANSDDAEYYVALDYLAIMPNLEYALITDVGRNTLQHILSGDWLNDEVEFFSGNTYFLMKNVNGNTTVEAIPSYNGCKFEQEKIVQTLASIDYISEKQNLNVSKIVLEGQTIEEEDVASFVSNSGLSHISSATFTDFYNEYGFETYCVKAPNDADPEPKQYDLNGTASSGERLSDAENDSLFVQAVEEASGDKTINANFVPSSYALIKGVSSPAVASINITVDSRTVLIYNRDNSYAKVNRELPKDVLDAIKVETLDVSDAKLDDVLFNMSDNVKHITGMFVSGGLPQFPLSKGVSNTLGYPTKLLNVLTIDGSSTLPNRFREDGFIKPYIDDRLGGIVSDGRDTSDNMFYGAAIDFFRSMFNLRCKDSNSSPNNIQVMPYAEADALVSPAFKGATSHLNEKDLSYLYAVYDFVRYFNLQEDDDSYVKCYKQGLFKGVVKDGKKMYATLSDINTVDGRVVEFFYSETDSDDAIGSAEIKLGDDGLYTFVGEGALLPPNENGYKDILENSVNVCSGNEDYVEYTITKEADGSIVVSWVNMSSLDPFFVTVNDKAVPIKPLN